MKVFLMIASVFVLFGCVDENYRVDCDGGFSTGLVSRAGVYEGVITWKDFGGVWSSRKMKAGEICQLKAIAK